MTRRHRDKPVSKKLRSLYLWHRWIGLVSAVFVVLLAVSGLALNHTESMSLDSHHVQSPLLLDWYGIEAPDDIITYRVGTLSVSSIGKQVYINTAPAPAITPPLSGAARFGEFIIVAAADRLALLNSDGELVEQLGRVAGVPAGLLSIGVTPDGQLILRTTDGYFVTDSELSGWYATSRPDVIWSHPTTPAAELTAALQQAYRGTGLPVERVVLDLHSGRILGEWGIYLMDGAAIIFLLLAVSGIWLWTKRRASARRHRRKEHTDIHPSRHKGPAVTPVQPPQQAHQ